MKRSKMLKKISDIIATNRNDYGYITPSNDIAEMILDYVEKEGMHPPTIESDSWQILDNGEMTYEVMYWENE